MGKTQHNIKLTQIRSLTTFSLCLCYLCFLSPSPLSGLQIVLDLSSVADVSSPCAALALKMRCTPAELERKIQNNKHSASYFPSNKSEHVIRDADLRHILRSWLNM